MVGVRGLVFDLDDTLHYERAYVRSGFQAVARALGAGALGARVDEAAAFRFLWGGFVRGVRGNAFDRLLDRFGLRGAVEVAALVDVYRLHRPGITLAPGVSRLLDRYAGCVPTGLITDGPRAMQQAKVDALGLAGRIEVVVVTDAWGRDFWKPHERAFAHVEEALGLAGRALVYVGDNPGKDFVTPRARGWRTVRLRNRHQLRYRDEPPTPAHAPDAEVRTVAALAALLRRWGY